MALDSVAEILRGRKVFDLGVELFPGMPHVRRIPLSCTRWSVSTGT